MKFIDETEIEVRAGKGGDGCVSFRRERFRPRGGPDGGDGGRGGSIVLVADAGLRTLFDHSLQKLYRARNGQPGSGKDRNGAGADDVLVRVPVGTVVFEASSGELLGDLSTPGQQLVVARGGRGGRGNIHFKSSVNQSPRRAETGQPGERRRLRLELKLLADVGVVGFPNAGKSTLVAALSRARPKVADYPFTTLVPTLGVVPVDEGRQFVIADVPGLIPGAARGAGLGLRFLRHLERCSVLLHLLTWQEGEDPQPRKLLQRFEQIEQELRAFGAGLEEKPRLVALSKRDLAEVRQVEGQVREELAARGLRCLTLSAASRDGLPELVSTLADLLWPVNESG
ncbi:MAG: GTPase ObgE [Deltaproteobacteria bacterium]|nr:MAG: GTPase ObgE [Deltaproteobacteria bacterium]